MSVELLEPAVKARAWVEPSLATPPPETVEVDSVEEHPPRPFVWTPALYRQAGEAGAFEGKRVELVRGEIIEMSPLGPQHVIGRRRVEYRLGDHFKEADGFIVDGQVPLRLADSEPEPDVIVFRGTIDEEPSDPERVLLVVEVAKTTLTFDRGVKLALYAETGYRDYWILNLNARTLEVYRDPRQQTDNTWEYGNRATYDADAVVRPLANPEAELRVADLLPPANV